MVAAVTSKNLHTLFMRSDTPRGNPISDQHRAAKEENWTALLQIIENWTSQRSARSVKKS